jgi:hypothetical protein
VIEDLDGGAPEPSRRGHVALLSAAVAAVSLVMLFALIVPPELGVAPQAASPLPIDSAAPVMTIVSGPSLVLPWERYSQSGTTAPSGVNVKVVSECADGSRIDAPYYLVFEGNGQVIAVPLDASTARSPQFTPVDRGSGWLTVSCATSTIRVPRIDRRR